METYEKHEKRLREAKYIGYSRLYKYGRPISRPFKSYYAQTAEEAAKQTIADNKRWNKRNKNKGIIAKFVTVKRKKPKHKKSQQFGLFGMPMKKHRTMWGGFGGY